MLLNARTFALGLLVVAIGCNSAYYSLMESFGVEKREILADEVEQGREDQEAAKEQFRSALERFKALTDFQGGDLAAAYEDLKAEFEDAEARADDVRDRIDSIEDVAAALFEEWEAEIDQLSTQDLRARSRTLLADTRGRYQQLIGAMRDAEASMDPVLAAFRDQVLTLKHTLNAQAIASLQSDVVQIEDDVEALIADMERSIAEADAFLQTLG